MLSIIEKSLSKSYSYLAYRDLVTSLLNEGKSTGNDQSEDLTHYSALNETRMNRLDKTIRITDENVSRLKGLQKKYIWLVISEGWCGDAAQIVPIISKMAELSDNVEMKIALRDENAELMDLFLTNGSRGIPKLIILDKESLAVLGEFGPRPEGAKNLILDYKSQHGIIDETAKTNLQLWYLHDKGLSVQKEILDLMATIDAVAQKPLA